MSGLRKGQKRPVVGYEGRYEVDDLGQVFSLDRVTLTTAGYRRKSRGCVLKPRILRNGYLQVDLYADGTQHHALVHALVLAAFVGPRPDGMEVAHNNGDKQDNRLANLRYATSAENTWDTHLHGKGSLALLTADQVLDISARLYAGAQYADLATEFGVTEWAIKHIAYGKRWGWLTGRKPRSAA